MIRTGYAIPVRDGVGAGAAEEFFRRHRVVAAAAAVAAAAVAAAAVAAAAVAAAAVAAAAAAAAAVAAAAVAAAAVAAAAVAVGVDPKKVGVCIKNVGYGHFVTGVFS